MKPRKYSKKDKLRQPGDHWYEVIDLFDPNKIRGLGRGLFIMGKLDDVNIVEVPAGTTQRDIASLVERLRGAGIKSTCFVIQAGTRFVKLKALTEMEEAKIEAEITAQREAFLAKQQEEAARAAGQSTDADSPGT